MKNILYLSICLLSSLLPGSTTLAQQTPAPPQQQAVLIRGAFAHIGNGQVIPNSLIGFENGKITLVADASNSTDDLSRFTEIIEAKGKHVYPGFIAPNSQLGLSEIDAVRSTRDHTEVGKFNPSIRSLIAYNTDSRITPTVRSNGVLLAQIVPKGGRISGQSSVVQLDAWNWEDATLAADDGIHINWPTHLRRRWSSSGITMSKNKDYDEQVNELLHFLKEAQSYGLQKAPEKTNLKFEAMRGLFEEKKNLYVHAQQTKSISDAVQMLRPFPFRLVIVGGRDSWKLLSLLKEADVAVVLAPTQSLPRHRGDHIDQPFKTASMLHEAGISFCLSQEDGWQQRNLPFQAGQAVGFGLDREAAISALSLNTARILGIDDKVGSLEKGKAATLFISKGDALDMRTCLLERAFIDGRDIDLDNKQKALYRKFREKYGKEKE
ncbi:MAG: amidohydrolase family protein [Bacteroidota bacterium]